MIEGIEAAREAFARERYFEAGPGVNFLSTSHPIANFAAANYAPAVSEAGPYEFWAEAGRKSAEERANARWKAMLEAYEAPPLDEAMNEALRAFIDRKWAAGPDRWR